MVGVAVDIAELDVGTPEEYGVGPTQPAVVADQTDLPVGRRQPPAGDQLVLGVTIAAQAVERVDTPIHIEQCRVPGQVSVQVGHPDLLVDLAEAGAETEIEHADLRADRAGQLRAGVDEDVDLHVWVQIVAHVGEPVAVRVHLDASIALCVAVLGAEQDGDDGGEKNGPACHVILLVRCMALSSC